MDQATAVKTGGSVTAIAESAPLTLTATHDEADRNPIFDALVTGEGEVSGLVAYSIYKQNKRAWLDDFTKLTGRTPTDAETRAYIIGESTERRLNIYRQLASATLAHQPGRPAGSGATASVGGMVGVLWALVAILALALLGFGLHAANLLGAK